MTLCVFCVLCCALCVLLVCSMLVLVCHADPFPPLPLTPCTHHSAVCTFKTPPECTFKTYPCVPSPRQKVLPHAGVVQVHTGTFWMYTRSFQRATPHRTHAPRPQRHKYKTQPPPPQQHTETGTERQRETERGREKRERDKRCKTREKGRWKTREKRIDIFWERMFEKPQIRKMN